MFNARIACCIFAFACNAKSVAPMDPPTDGEERPPDVTGPVPFDDFDDADGEGECVAPEVVSTRARLLTRFEYNNTVRDLLGDKTNPARDFPTENRILAFDNDASTHNVSPLLVDQYQAAAEVIAPRAVLENRALLVPCDPASGAMSCGVRFVDRLLRRAFRGTVSAEEAAPYYGLFKVGLDASGFDMGVEMVVEAVLQSPRFLYRIETGPTHEVRASRLSYFLWGSMPDEALLQASLSNGKEVEAEARRMLADHKARDSVKHFFLQWLDLEGLESLPKDVTVYPEFRNSMRRSWASSIERYIEHVTFGAGTVEALFTEPVVFTDDLIEPLYTPFDATTRAGLLTQPALLAKLAHPDQSSPIRRGVFVRERILCELLPSPPNNVDITPPDPDPDATTRERFAEHTSNATCRGCHGLIDPIGFGFERYDGLGRYRDTENGLPIDDSGELVGTRDPTLVGPYAGAIELSERLAASDEVRQCLITQLFRFAMGRAETEDDECTLRRLDHTLLAADGRIDELLVAIALEVAR